MPTLAMLGEMRSLFFISVLAIAPIHAAENDPARPLKSEPPLPVPINVQTLVLSNLVTRIIERSVTPPEIYFLGATVSWYEEGDPPPDLLKAVSELFPVKPMSAANSGKGGIRDRASGKRGVLIIWGQPSWIDSETVEIPVTRYHEREPRHFDQAQIYVVKKQRGGWEVLGRRVQ